MIAALGEHEPVLEGSGHFIADDATVIGKVRLGDASGVWFNAVIRGDNDLVGVGRESTTRGGSANGFAALACATPAGGDPCASAPAHPPAARGSIPPVQRTRPGCRRR